MDSEAIAVLHRFQWRNIGSVPGSGPPEGPLRGRNRIGTQVPIIVEEVWGDVKLRAPCPDVSCYVSAEVSLTRRAAGNLPNGPDVLNWERVPPSPPLFRSRQVRCARRLRGGGLASGRTVVLPSSSTNDRPNSPAVLPADMAWLRQAPGRWTRRPRSQPWQVSVIDCRDGRRNALPAIRAVGSHADPSVPTLRIAPPHET